jgi:hypothetical protein
MHDFPNIFFDRSPFTVSNSKRLLYAFSDNTPNMIWNWPMVFFAEEIYEFQTYTRGGLVSSYF